MYVSAKSDPPSDPSNPIAEATYQDVLDAPEHQVAQIIDGQLIVMPRPSPHHAWAGSGLGYDLIGPFQRGIGGPGGWIILDEPEIHFPRARQVDRHGHAVKFSKHVLVPDLAGWKSERLPTLPATNFFELAPDWLCEVLSPSTAGIDRIKKMPIYHQQKIGHVWIIDPRPEAHTLEVFRYENAGYTLVQTFSGDEVVRAEPFDAVELNLKALWP